MSHDKNPPHPISSVEASLLELSNMHMKNTIEMCINEKLTISYPMLLLQEFDSLKCSPGWGSSGMG